MRRVAILTGAMLLSPFGAFFGQNAPANTSRIVGIVVDSIRGVGLQGAEVMVSGFSSTTTTDSLGRFAIEGIAPGTYEVGVFHPVIEALGLTLTTKPFVLGRDSTGIANLAVPSPKTLASRYCGAALTNLAPATVVGRVRHPDTDQPVFGATISLEWVDIAVSGRNRLVRTPHELLTGTDSSGFFKFCGLPGDLDGTVQATHSGVSTGEVPVVTSGNPLTFENLTIAPPRVIPTRGFVRGTVFSVDDKPIGGARVEAFPSRVSNVTKDDGTFSLGEVPTGTQLVLVSHSGFAPVGVSVNVTSRQPTDIRVTLEPNINIKDPAVVTARQYYALEH
jgi:hypothetical protein